MSTLCLPYQRTRQAWGSGELKGEREGGGQARFKRRLHQSKSLRESPRDMATYRNKPTT